MIPDSVYEANARNIGIHAPDLRTLPESEFVQASGKQSPDLCNFILDSNHALFEKLNDAEQNCSFCDTPVLVALSMYPPLSLSCVKNGFAYTLGNPANPRLPNMARDENCFFVGGGFRCGEKMQAGRCKIVDDAGRLRTVVRVGVVFSSGPDGKGSVSTLIRKYVEFCMKNVTYQANYRGVLKPDTPVRFGVHLRILPCMPVQQPVNNSSPPTELDMPSSSIAALSVNANVSVDVKGVRLLELFNEQDFRSWDDMMQHTQTNARGDTSETVVSEELGGRARESVATYPLIVGSQCCGAVKLVFDLI